MLRCDAALQQVRLAANEFALRDALAESARTLNADQAGFVSQARRERFMASGRFTPACDPVWSQRYIAERHHEHDPWLDCVHGNLGHAVAPTHADDPLQQRVIDFHAEHGFHSAYVVAIHPVAGASRRSVLYLGSSTPGHFEDGALSGLSTYARMLALEMSDWWSRRIRHELLASARLTHEELALLGFELRQYDSKRIAALLGVSKSSIDSRFQRINLKIGAPNRRTAAQLAAEGGLLGNC